MVFGLRTHAGEGVYVGKKHAPRLRMHSQNLYVSFPPPADEIPHFELGGFFEVSIARGIHVGFCILQARCLAKCCLRNTGTGGLLPGRERSSRTSRAWRENEPLVGSNRPPVGYRFPRGARRCKNPSMQCLRLRPSDRHFSLNGRPPISRARERCGATTRYTRVAGARYYPAR